MPAGTVSQTLQKLLEQQQKQLQSQQQQFEQQRQQMQQAQEQRRQMLRNLGRASGWTPAQTQAALITQRQLQQRVLQQQHHHHNQGLLQTRQLHGRAARALQETETRQAEHERQLKTDEAEKKRQQEKHRAESQLQNQQRSQHMKGAAMSAARGDMAGLATNALGAVAGAGPAAIAAAVYEGVKAAGQTITQVANIHGNSMLTEGQKDDETARTFGLGWMVDFRDAVTGTTNALRRIGIAAENAALAGNQQRGKEMTRAAMSAQENRSRYRGLKLTGATGGIYAAGAGLSGDRATYAGELAYQQASIRFPAQVALSRAQGERNAAAQSHTEGSAYLKSRQRKLLGSVDEMRKSEAAFETARKNDPSRGPAAGSDAKEDIAERQADLGNAAKQVMADQLQVQEAINRQKELGLSLAEKDRAVAQAKTGILKADLEIDRQKEQRQATAAHTLGTMNPAQRAMALAAVKMAMKSKDIGTLPPQFRALAQQVAPGMMGKLAERSGLGTKEYKDLQELGAVDKGDLDERRKAIGKMQTDIEVKVQLDEAALAHRIADAIGIALKDLLKSIDIKHEAERAAQKVGQQVRNAPQH